MNSRAAESRTPTATPAERNKAKSEQMIVIRQQKKKKNCIWCPLCRKWSCDEISLFYCRNLPPSRSTSSAVSIHLSAVSLCVSLVLFLSLRAASISFYTCWQTAYKSAVYPPPACFFAGDWLRPGPRSAPAPSSDSQRDNSGRFARLGRLKQELKIKRGERKKIAFPRENPRRLHFRISAKRQKKPKKTGGLAKPSHDRKKTPALSNLNWTCARGVHDYDGCVETEVNKQKERGKKKQLSFSDVQKCFVQRKKDYSANSLGKVFQQATDHAMQSNMNKE